MEPVLYNNKEYQELLQHLEKLMQEAEDSPFPQTKEIVFNILRYFDLIHREPLSRLMQLMENTAPELRAKLETDYTIKTLFSLYDLMAGEIERSPLKNTNTVGFVAAEMVGLITPVDKEEKGDD